MKEIKAFVRPNKVNEIVHHLIDNDFENITLSSAEGTEKLQDENAFVSQKFSVTDSEIAKLEIVAEDEDVDTICAIICEYGCTLNPGDGLIYVSDVEKVYRVKTGLGNGEK
ncbi:P-II family nitrogen regulator [Marinifilum sp. D714]|jgi:nitrogen regulatory protein P-II 1|uniref:P-II family nitrogen regulator n=1 Tax=Marinifilum sp. D714 TaxID=2937523 RepID=UPI0027C2E54F|nr:P-II family nitrogen regulator [Marinifilum sp. D714]MDQ2180830.1 P-II family nitrogen regulator [Marinifilum sp. D714]